MSVKSTKPKEKKEPKIGLSTDRSFRKFLSLQRFIKKTFPKDVDGKYQYCIAALGVNPQTGETSILFRNHCNRVVFGLLSKIVERQVLEEKKKAKVIDPLEEILLNVLDNEIGSVTKKKHENS